MIKAVFVDMDETLIVNEPIYDLARSKLYGYLENFGISQAEIKTDLYKTDAELYKTFGYSHERFPMTFETVLKHFVPNADAAMVKTVRDFAYEVFDTVAAVKPGVPEAIDMLKDRGYKIYIVTAGDREVQEKRLQALPFLDKLEGAFIVDKKDKPTFDDLIKKLGYKPSETVMVGDSLRSDVLPAVAAGLKSVWIEAYNSPHEAAEGFPERNAYKYSSLLEFARSLAQKGRVVAPYTPKPPKAA